MKKTALLLTAALFAVALCGCSPKENTTEPTSATTASVSETTLTTSSVTAQQPTEEPFCGLKKSVDYTAANTLSSLNADGLLCSDGAGGLYAATEEKLVRISEGVSTEVYDGDVLGLNLLNDELYFIDKSDKNRIKKMSLTDGSTEVIVDKEALYLLVTDAFIVYSDMNNSLYLRLGEDERLISDKKVGWVNLYGEWLIFTEFDSGCRVAAYSIATGETLEVLPYGFFPALDGDMLYYQEKSAGYVGRISLIDGQTERLTSEWGQAFCFVNDGIYFRGSFAMKYINPQNGTIEQVYGYPKDITVHRLFECGGELYFTETDSDENSVLMRLTAENKVVNAI